MARDINSKLSAQNWISASITLVIVALVSKGLGFVREILVAKYFGTSAQVDAFMVATSLPMLVGGGIGLALSIALIPMYQKVLASGGADRANRLVGSAVISATVFSILFMLPLWVKPLPFIQLVAPSLPEPTANLAAELTRWLSLYILGLNLVYVLMAAYHAFQHFKVPAVSDLAFNGMTILVLIGFALPLGIHALVFGNLVGIFLCLSLLAYFLLRQRRARFGPEFPSTDLKSLLLMAIPILLVEFASQMSAVVENYFASGLTEGSIAALNYAKKVSATIIALVAINVARGVFPTLSTLFSEDNPDEARAVFVKLNKQIIVLFVPLAVLCIILRKEILGVLYMRGAFDLVALEMTSTIFLFYAAGLVIATVEPIFLRACYAFSDMRTPLVSTVLSVVVMVPVTYFLMPVMGISGIALAVNLVLFLRVAIQAVSVQKKLGGVVIGEMLEVIAISLLCAVTAATFLFILPTDHVLTLFASILIYFLGYFGLGWFLMRREIGPLYRFLAQRSGASSIV